jgi:hypothetical protein
MLLVFIVILKGVGRVIINLDTLVCSLGVIILECPSLALRLLNYRLFDFENPLLLLALFDGDLQALVLRVLVQDGGEDLPLVGASGGVLIGHLRYESVVHVIEVKYAMFLHVLEHLVNVVVAPSP